MSKRSDIIGGARVDEVNFGLVYIEVLGWVDLGHAQGTDIRNLLRDIDSGERQGEEYYDVSYSQSMSERVSNIKMGKFIKWRIKRGRTLLERRSIALEMMVSLTRKFEGLQASFPINLMTDSGFSGEDLVSNLLGFYRVVSIPKPFGMLGVVSREKALQRWDHYGKIGGWKNESFRPLLFPDPDIFPNARPYKGNLPNFMQTVRPWSDFRSGIVRIASAEGSYIDKAKGGTLLYA